MAILGLGYPFNFLNDGVGGYTPNYKTKKNSSTILITIVITHSLCIFIALSAKTKQRENLPFQPFLQFVQLQPENSVIQNIEKPDVHFQSKVIHIHVPKVEIVDNTFLESELNQSLPVMPYELPNSNDVKYGNIFDPKIRQKLIDAQGLNKPRPKEKEPSWTEADGRTFVNIGDGMCLVSIPIVDSRQRGTNWGMTRCGKTDSEKMMDNVTADLESRKYPLKTQ